jgi:iron complex transport system permease protein
MDRRKKIAIILTALVVIFAMLLFLELRWAQLWLLSPQEVWDSLIGNNRNYRIIVIDLNLTRVLFGMIVGAGLAVAGAVMQALFRNPMASPYTLGLSSGASLGAAIGILFPLSFVPVVASVPILAFLFCLGTMFLVYSLAKVGNQTHMETLLLAGIAVAALAQAVVSLLTYIAGENISEIVFWGMGSLTVSLPWVKIPIVLILSAVGIFAMLYYAKDLNAMMLGDAHAMDLGIDVKRTRLALLIASSLVTAAAVCFVGTIGFVGLVIPHILRILLGPDNRMLLPMCVLTGGIYLVGCDYIAHLFAQSLGVLPIGVVTSLIGAPYFIYLLRRRKREVGWV